MPIRIDLKLTTGWKAYSNDRFGEVLELQFINTKDNNVMFRYAPKLDDEQTFNEYFLLLKELDTAYKQVKSVVNKIQKHNEVGKNEKR